MRGQRGIALITVLLVVAVVVVVCAGLIVRQQLSIRSAANQLHVNQAWHYALGGERLASAMLQRDWRRGQNLPALDHLGEPWAKALPVFALDEGGEVRVRITDPTGRFNLNSLVNQGQVDELALQRFRRLLLRLELDTAYAERLLDWLDADGETSGAAGAEDNAYLLAEPAFRTANRELGDISELRLLAGMQEAHYQRLRPYVSALPTATAINVNTASAMVLASLADSLDPFAAQGLLAARQAAPFASAEVFAAQPALAGQGEQVGLGLAVNTEYFEVISEVQFAERQVVLRSLLQRSQDGQISVLARDLGQNAVAKAVKEPAL